MYIKYNKKNETDYVSICEKYNINLLAGSKKIYLNSQITRLLKKSKYSGNFFSKDLMTNI